MGLLDNNQKDDTNQDNKNRGNINSAPLFNHNNTKQGNQEKPDTFSAYRNNATGNNPPSPQGTTTPPGTIENSISNTTATASSVGGSTTSGAIASGAATGSTTAAPIILIVILCVGLFLIFSILLKALTPENTTSVVVEYTKCKFDITVEKISDTISNIFDKLFGIRDELEKIEADESLYDKSNEYDVAFIQNFNTINTALNAAYKINVDQYLKDYCKSHNYSYTKSKQKLAEKYPNGWQDIYSSVNYGEFINILSLGYKTGAYGTNVEQGDTKALTKFLLDENNWDVFFNIYIEATTIQQGNSNDNTSSSLTDLEEQENTNAGTSATSLDQQDEFKNTSPLTDSINHSDNSTEAPTEDFEEIGSVLDISIYPFCLNDLFIALGIQKDAEYYNGITYYEMLELMKLQDIAICESSSGVYRQIYYTLGLDKPSATWNYSFSSSTVPNIFANTNLIPATGDNPQIVWTYLKQGGFSDEGAAGIMGNLMAENGFRTNMAGEGGSVGLAQWTGTRKASLIALAQSMNMDVTDIHVQAQFLLYELSFTKYDVIRNATDITLAADYTAYYYEACSRYSSYEAYLNGKYAGVINWSRYTYSETFNTYILDLNNRRNYSYTYYEQFAGTI